MKQNTIDPTIDLKSSFLPDNSYFIMSPINSIDARSTVNTLCNKNVGRVFTSLIIALINDLTPNNQYFQVIQ